MLIWLTFLYLFLSSRVKHDSELKQRECWPSRASWIASGSSMFRLMERFYLTQRIWILPFTFHCANFLSQSTERQIENIHFQFPFLMPCTSTFSLLIKHSVLAGMGRGEEVRVNTLSRLWTIYFWLTSQLSTVQYIYVANLKCMAAQ